MYSTLITVVNCVVFFVSAQNFGELLLAQVLTAMLIVALGASISAIYFVLYIIPVEKLFAFFAK